MAERPLSLDYIVVIDEDNVVSRKLQGEAVLLNLQSGTYFGLNEVGTRIWTLFGEKKSLRQVFETLKQEYDVAPETLEQDLLRLVGELKTKGLVDVLRP